MDKEFFECDEYEESKEIQYFSAEKYRVSENAKSAEETFDAPETYVSGNMSAKHDDKGMSLGDAEELAQSASAHASASATASVSMTAGTSASAGATGVFASIAAVCVAVTAGIVPVAGITQDYPEEPPIYQEEEPAGEPTEVGSLSFLNYRVEYYRNEDSDEIFSDITFYFEGTLNDGYTCELSDASTGVAVGIEDNTAVFVNVDRGDRDFYLTIYDDNDEVVETRTVNVEDNYIYDNSLDVDYAYKVTYNPDNTGNLYAYLIPGREGDFVTYINIFTSSEDGAYETVSDGLLSAVFNISEEKYWVNFVSYYVKDNNYYSYFSSEEICISNSSFDWSASVTDDKLTLNFGNELNGLVEVRVTYEDSAYEDLSFTADESGGNTYELTLSRISRNPTVEVFASAVLYDHDPSGYITGTVGLNYREVYGYAEVSAFVSSAVTLSRCEIFNSGYNIVSDDETYAPVRLYFDGFLNDGDTYSVTVINADGEEIKSVTGLTLSDE
ncbi:MAG: hypothetical protein ACI4S9_06225, partial [Christensenellales bacterium]